MKKLTNEEIAKILCSAIELIDGISVYNDIINNPKEREKYKECLSTEKLEKIKADVTLFVDTLIDDIQIEADNH